MTRSRRIRLIGWGAIAIVAIIGIGTAEIAKRLNTHAYSSKHAPVPWPDQLTLDRADLAQYLRYQFNVEVTNEDGHGDDLQIRAGLCQVAGRHTIEASDIVAADAIVLIVQQPCFEEFVEAHKDELKRLHTVEALPMGELREQFVKDLATTEGFQSDFPRFIENAADGRGLHVRWISGGGRQLAR